MKPVLLLVITVMSLTSCSGSKGSKGGETQAILPQVINEPVSNGGNTESANQKLVDVGSWGGELMEMSVASNGAEVEFKCFHAGISEPLVLGEDSTFKVSGEVTRLGGAQDGQSVGQALFFGRVDGKHMTVKVSYQIDGQPQEDQFSLNFDAGFSGNPICN